MPDHPLMICLPTDDRAHAFYRDGLGFDTPGELADDGVPEPLVVTVNAAARVMLIPRGGFGWAVGEASAVAGPGTSECLLSLGVATTTDVDQLVERARAAGAVVTAEPTQQPWGYEATFADPDGHLWSVAAAPA